MSTKKVEPNSEKPKYAVTAQERAAINKVLTRNATNPAPRLKMLKEKGARFRWIIQMASPARRY